MIPIFSIIASFLYTFLLLHLLGKWEEPDGFIDNTSWVQVPLSSGEKGKLIWLSLHFIIAGRASVCKGEFGKTILYFKSH